MMKFNVCRYLFLDSKDCGAICVPIMGSHACLARSNWKKHRKRVSLHVFGMCVIWKGHPHINDELPCYTQLTCEVCFKVCSSKHSHDYTQM